MNKAEKLDPLMTVDEVAEYLRTTPGVIRVWVHQKKIPFVKINNSLKFKESEIINYVNMNSSTNKNEVENLVISKKAKISHKRRY